MSLTLLGTILIYVAGLLWIIEMYPQISKTVKTKNVKGVSLAYFLICLIAYILYCIGNLLLGNMNIVIVHVPSVILNAFMLFLIIKYREK